jgi:hypothetical protein
MFPHLDLLTLMQPATYSWLIAGEAERIHGGTLKANDNPNVRFFTQRVPVGPVGLLCP